MKKILTFIFVLVICFTLHACAYYTYDNTEAPTSSAAEPASSGGMEYIGTSYDPTDNVYCFHYYRDKVTDVMYVCFEEYRKGGLTVMLNPDTGLPLTYTRYLEIKADNENL